MSGVTYDAGALIAAERGVRRMWVLHDEFRSRDVVPIVPAVVLAQVWRGGPQALVSRLLAGCCAEWFGEAHAREVGKVLASSGTSDLVDAAVVAGAIARNHAIVTSDPDDLNTIAHALGATLRLHVV